jgi:hypothetical protein
MTTWIIAVPEGHTVKYIRSPFVQHPMAIKQEHLAIHGKLSDDLAGELADRPTYEAERWDVV